MHIFKTAAAEVKLVVSDIKNNPGYYVRNGSMGKSTGRWKQAS